MQTKTNEIANPTQAKPAQYHPSQFPLLVIDKEGSIAIVYYREDEFAFMYLLFKGNGFYKPDWTWPNLDGWNILPNEAYIQLTQGKVTE